MDIIPIIVATFWIVGMVLDHAKFTALWQSVGYRFNAFISMLRTPEGKEKLRDFPFLGRILFSVGIIILAYGMDETVLLSGILFILFLGIVHNLCRCTRKRFPFPSRKTLKTHLITVLAIILEIAFFFVISLHYPAPYILLGIISLRFLFTTLATFILSPLSEDEPISH